MIRMHSFTSYPDLASRDLAGSVISANDELFAPRQNLISRPTPYTRWISRRPVSRRFAAPRYR